MASNAKATNDVDTGRSGQTQGARQMPRSISGTSSTGSFRILGEGTVDEQEDNQGVASQSTTSRRSSRFPVTDALSRVSSGVSTRIAHLFTTTGTRPGTSDRSALLNVISEPGNRGTRSQDFSAVPTHASTSMQSGANRSALLDLISDSDSRSNSSAAGARASEQLACWPTLWAIHSCHFACEMREETGVLMSSPRIDMRAATASRCLIRNLESSTSRGMKQETF